MRATTQDVSQNAPAISLKTPLLALKASAGSGKTFALATRYIILLFQGARAHEILAITFTRKATKEMQERIQNALCDLAQGVQGAFYQSLLAEGFSPQEIAHNAPRIYQAFLRDRARILTIDAFFTTILKKFSYFAGLRADFTMIDDGQSALESIKESFLESSAKGSSLESLAKTCAALGLEFDRLFSFIQAGFEDRLHFSNAMLKRYRELDTNTLLAHSRDKQARVMILLQEVRQILASAGERLEMPLSTQGYNALSFASFEEFLDKDKITWLMQEPSAYQYFKKILTKDEVTNVQVCERIEEIKQCMGEIFASKERATLAQIARMITQYSLAHKRVLAARNMLGFSDCMLELYSLLAQELESNLEPSVDSRDLVDSRLVIDPLFFYFRLDTTIAHILIDEFQDTNPMQYRILQPLIDEICAGFGAHGKEHRSFFIVGDSKQSIYRFRGSESGFFDKVAGGLRLNVQNLPYNYRSYSEIVGFVNAVFARVFSDYIPQQLPKESDKNGGFVRVCKLHIKSQKSSGRVSKQEVEPAMLDYAIQTLGELLESRVNAQDIAFLCFKNTEAQSLRNAIKAHFPHINIVLEARAKITDEKSVKALLCALQLANFVRTKLESRLDSSALLASDEARFYLYKLVKLLGGKAFVSPSPSAIAQTFLHALERCPNDTKPSRYLLAFIKAFELGDKSAQLLLEYSLESSSIEELFTQLEAQIPDAPKDDQQGLRILTIHKSKGLEFPYVVVLDRFSKAPNDNAQILHTQDKKVLLHLQELHKRRKELDERYKQAQELRATQSTIEDNNVLYVACTRAQKGLIIIARQEQSSLLPIINNLPAQLESTQQDPKVSSTKAHKHNAHTPITTEAKDSDPILQESLYHPEIVLESGAIIQSQILKPKPKSTPQILQQEHFGKQEFPATQAQDGFVPHIASMRFGEALHLGLEYQVGFGVAKERVREILRYKFGLESSALDAIDSRIQALRSDPRFLTLLERAGDSKVLVEVPLFTDWTLRRLDVLVHCVCEDREEFIVVDYKSGAPRSEHTKQVQEYMQALRYAYGEQIECQGYVAYIRDPIQVVSVV